MSQNCSDNNHLHNYTAFNINPNVDKSLENQMTSVNNTKINHLDHFPTQVRDIIKYIYLCMSCIDLDN